MLGRKYIQTTQTIPVAAKQRATKHVSSSSAHVQPVQPEKKVQPDKRVEQDNTADTDEHTQRTVSEIGRY